MNDLRRPLDGVDVSLIAELRRRPRTSFTSLARLVGIARGTVYSRMERLEHEGVITGYGPEVDAQRAGFGVLAFVLIEISQGSLEETVRELERIPQILEVHTVTGQGDLMCKILGRSNDHLHQVLQAVAALPAVLRSETNLALATNLQRSVADVLLGSQ